MDMSVDPEDLPKNTKRDKGFEFINAIKGGAIPQEFISPIEKGVKEAVSRGVVAGYPIMDIEVKLFDGSYHEVDSSEAAFKMAASMALQEAAKNAKPVILEPIMKVQIIIPMDYLGEVTGNVNSKRGRIDAINDRGNTKIIDCKIPLSQMFGYVTELRSMTQGRGSSTMEFDHYEPTPKNIEAEIVSGKRK